MKILCLLISFSAFPVSAQTVELKLLDTVSQNFLRNDNEALLRSTLKLLSSIGNEIPSTLRTPLGIEAAQTLARPGSEKSVAIWITKLDEALRAKNMQLAYHNAVGLNQLAGRKMYDETDHASAYKEALTQAQSRPNVMNFRLLQVRAMVTKEYPAMLEAGEKAWLLRDTDEMGALLAEPVHQSQQSAALAAFELGQIDRAAALLISSLDLPRRRWSSSSTEMKVADQLLQKQHRSAVIAYLEVCLKTDWPNRTAILKQWLEDSKLGKTPNYSFRSKPSYPLP